MDVTSLRFHHFGLATRDLAQSARFLIATGFRVGPTVSIPEQSVDLALAEHSQMPTVELISPRSGVEGPIDRLLAAQATAIYHLGYECRSIETSMVELRRAGFRVCRRLAEAGGPLWRRSCGLCTGARFRPVELIEEAVR